MPLCNLVYLYVIITACNMILSRSHHFSWSCWRFRRYSVWFFSRGCSLFIAWRDVLFAMHGRLCQPITAITCHNQPFSQVWGGRCTRRTPQDFSVSQSSIFRTFRTAAAWQEGGLLYTVFCICTLSPTICILYKKVFKSNKCLYSYLSSLCNFVSIFSYHSQEWQ